MILQLILHLKYLKNYSIIRLKSPKIEIMRLNIIDNRFYTVIINTHWISIIQRHWKKTYANKDTIRGMLNQYIKLK